ncbi:MAG: hemerythrin [Clostridiaceae bacterium]|jgi:hemerythrin-like domain-containing protein|nr:hemerythrin [Clostridiaceae bacterium]
MKYASEDLKNEHEGILFGLQVLEKMAYLINDYQPVDDKDLREMVHFLQLFADKCHHGKEEGLYFPSLEKAGIQNNGGPVGQLLLEHTEGRNHIAHMADAMTPALQADAFVKAAIRYIQLMRGHIDKENQTLFISGDQVLPANEQMRLLEAFEVFEEQVMGAGTHQKLHNMLDRFEKKYLS